VRMKLPITAFSKESDQRYSSAVYTISEVIPTEPVASYRLRSLDDIDLPQTLTRASLLQAEPDAFEKNRRVEKILKRSADGSRYLVSFVGYPLELAEWVDQDQLEQLRAPYGGLI